MKIMLLIVLSVTIFFIAHITFSALYVMSLVVGFLCYIFLQQNLVYTIVLTLTLGLLIDFLSINPWYIVTVSLGIWLILLYGVKRFLFSHTYSIALVAGPIFNSLIGLFHNSNSFSTIELGSFLGKTIVMSFIVILIVAIGNFFNFDEYIPQQEQN